MKNSIGILCDFARVILFPKDASYHGRLDQHSGTFFLNNELLTYFRSMKGKISMNVFSSGRNYEAPEIKNQLDPIFDHFFNTNDLGMSKIDPQVYIHIAQKLNKKPQEIVFIDDVPENVEASRIAGLHGIRYINNEQLFLQLQKFISTPMGIRTPDSRAENPLS